jgi:hypothetical protein
MIKKGITEYISGCGPVYNAVYLKFIYGLFIPSIAADGWSYFHFK